VRRSGGREVKASVAMYCLFWLWLALSGKEREQDAHL
jgi:hypothetical protein